MSRQCAIYTRYSSDLQRATSLEDQIRTCQQFAARMGWQVLDDHIYQDAALSGFGVEHRLAYRRLVATALISSPPFTVLLVDDLSRLSRDVAETIRLYRRLKRNGVELVSVTDGIQTSQQMAKLQIAIKGLVNELYLDDLRDKTHRGLTGRVLRGLSAGGRLFGYRTIPQGPDGREGAAWTVFEPETAMVRRIFQSYADGLSMKAIAVRLNQEGVPFPAKTTRWGPIRRGWALSTIHTILTNEKYRGHWVWNKTMFLKDPETGKRTAVARPETDWISEDRPDLRIVEEALWGRVQERLQAVRAAYGATTRQPRPRGQAPDMYSPYLLSGLMRCGVCGGRITIQVSRRRKASGRVYQYARYRCAFHATKGPAVCTNTVAIRQDVLEATLLAKFQEALTPEMVDDLVATVNKHLVTVQAELGRRTTAVEAERRRVETELARLVEFVTKGELDSPRLREEIRDRERQLADLEQQLDHARRQGPAPLQVHRTWVEEKLRNLHALVLRNPQRARLELQKHIEDLRLTPAGERTVKISGRAKTDGLLGEEAVCLQLVAGARNHRYRPF